MPLLSLHLIVFHSVFIACHEQDTCVLLDIYVVYVMFMLWRTWTVRLLLCSHHQSLSEAFKFVELSMEKFAWACSRSKFSKNEEERLRMTINHSWHQNIFKKQDGTPVKDDPDMSGCPFRGHWCRTLVVVGVGCGKRWPRWLCKLVLLMVAGLVGGGERWRGLVSLLARAGFLAGLSPPALPAATLTFNSPWWLYNTDLYKLQLKLSTILYLWRVLKIPA